MQILQTKHKHPRGVRRHFTPNAAPVLVFCDWVRLLNSRSCHPRERGDPFFVAFHVLTKLGFPPGATLVIVRGNDVDSEGFSDSPTATPTPP